MRDGKGGRSPVSWRDLPLFGDSCARPELPRRDADQALEVLAEMALVRESGGRRDLGQGEVTVLLQELLGPVDAAGDDVLVRGSPGGLLELAGGGVGGGGGGPPPPPPPSPADCAAGA